MSRLTLAALLLSALALDSTVARAEESQVPQASSARWNLDARGGYAASWTTGQPYLGLGAGLAGGVTLGAHVHLEVAALYHAGSTVSAENATLEYWSRNWSVLTHAAAGYQWTFGKRFLARPQVLVGCVLISDSMRLGEVTRDGVDPLLVVGAGVVMLVHFGSFHAGIDARTLFVPERVASPIGGLYAVFGWDL